MRYPLPLPTLQNNKKKQTETTKRCSILPKVYRYPVPPRRHPMGACVSFLIKLSTSGQFVNVLSIDFDRMYLHEE